MFPHQVGVRVPMGCEAIVHAVTSVHKENNIYSESKWALHLDFSNVFNCIKCQMMFEEVRAWIPSMSTWMECCYGAQPVLHFGDHAIRSCCGVQQVDQLGPLGLALALHLVHTYFDK